MKKTIFKKITLLTVLFFTAFTIAYSQETEGKTYRITHQQNHQKITTYKNAFEKANWNCYRTKNQTRVIAFDNGITFELFSATTAIANGINVPTNCLTESKNIVANPTYTLSSNGYIMEAVPSFSGSKEIKALQQDKQEKTPNNQK